MPQRRHYADAAEKQRAYRQRQAEARHAEQAAKGLPLAPAIPSIPGTVRWRALIAHARLALQTVHDEIETYVEMRSDAWQQSERADALNDCREALTHALDEIPSL